jgi:hypothetical protein
MFSAQFALGLKKGKFKAYCRDASVYQGSRMGEHSESVEPTLLKIAPTVSQLIIYSVPQMKTMT